MADKMEMKNQNIVIEAITPVVDGGRWSAKAIVGAPVLVEADIFRSGHEPIKAVVKWKKIGERKFREAPLRQVNNDRWHGQFVPAETGRYVFCVMACTEGRMDFVHSYELPLLVDRKKALVGNWYEAFIRSMGAPGKAATFREAENRLPEIQEMGFDVLYLAPIHPIGRTGRKGPHNQPAGPQDPGCPWAVGNENGGHTAIEPTLGTMADFDHFVETAKKLGLEIALDFAVQCSPDHPWVKQHPEWFYYRPDGSLKCAENPPHIYDDIVQINFDCEDWKDLWEEMKNLVLFWVKKGIKIFRVDNPHTKPTTFWNWLIESVRENHPDVLFLAESLTRPKPMKALSKAGFTQSYTYFLWKNTKYEITEYLTELTTTDMKYHFRPNFFITTQDNIHEYLQKGGRSAFQIRLALAATLSPTYGIYSGYELCESEAIAGTEEYKNSEKFQIPNRDWNKPGHIKTDITAWNHIRQENPALHDLTNLIFFDVDNEHLLAYGKATEDRSNIIFTVVNLDPHNKQSGTVRVPMDRYAMAWGQSYPVTNLLTNAPFEWAERNFVELDPHNNPVLVLRIQ